MSVDSVRIVPELRAVHIERHRLGTPAELLYLDTNYDLPGTALTEGIRRVSTPGALRRFLSTPATTLEVPEPLWIRFWPKHALLAGGFKVAGLLRGRRHRVVTYAMENNDLATLVGGRRGAPRRLVAAAAVLVGAVARLTLDRIAFATAASRSTYEQLPFVRGIEHTVGLELPAPARAVTAAVPLTCVFVGAMEERKGVRALMAAWPAVEDALPGARLVMVGPGPLEAEATAWAAAAPGSRRVTGRLHHAEAGEVLRTATVLVAPSVPDGRWKEQVGLPIKEALAAGLTVVTTDQTGLADWLQAHGHEVVDHRGSSFPDRLARSLVRALRAPLHRSRVHADLPEQDGRLVADAWLHGVRGRRARCTRDVVVVNTLGGALEHYTRGLAGALAHAGGAVSVVRVDEPSTAGGSALGWIRRYVAALWSVRRTARRTDARVVVTWPVLGHLDRPLLRCVLGRGVDVALVMHDPRPLVHARGYGVLARRVGRLGRAVRFIVHSATADRTLRAECPGEAPDVLPHPVVPRAVDAVPAAGGPGRPVVRVLGQYKPDRDLDLLAAVGRRLGATHRLEVVGRRWPTVPGWDVTDGFVPEERLDELMATADVVLVPYKRFFQSGVAIRALELGTPAVGPAGSSIGDLYPDDRFLASDDPESWCRAIEVATAADPAEVIALARSADQRSKRAWARWLAPGEDAPAVS